ncbi:pteridine reductase [Methyloglobulus sp.]|uniref:pteridine reductase n=1 Tax=Methyloglobulus sp. TaxID=2518622 RepID=UPI00398A2B46
MEKNVLITGAAKRIGAECAHTLHDQGCNVLLHYKSSKQEAGQLCNEFNQKRLGSAKLVQGNLLNMQELEAVAQVANSSWGGLDVLINNASLFYPTPLANMTEDQWDDLLGSNLKAPFFLAKALSDSLAKRQGCIVNIVDIHAERGLPGYPVYSIAKAGLVAMTKILAKELGPTIRVNAIAPGAILWPENGLSEQDKGEILQRVPLARCGSPQDIAKAVLYLVRDADYVTGQILTVDGGRTLFY